MHHATRFLRPALLAALLAGCAGTVTDTQYTYDPPPEGAWELVTSNFVESGRLPGLPRATLEMKDGRLAAYSGCNRGSGAVQSVAGRLSVPVLEMTRRACPEPVGTFDTRYFRLLKDGPVYQVEGATLRLVAGDYNAQFRRRNGITPTGLQAP